MSEFAAWMNAEQKCETTKLAETKGKTAGWYIYEPGEEGEGGGANSVTRATILIHPPSHSQATLGTHVECS